MCAHHQRRSINQIARMSSEGFFEVMDVRISFSPEQRVFCSDDDGLLPFCWVSGLKRKREREKKGKRGDWGENPWVGTTKSFEGKINCKN